MYNFCAVLARWGIFVKNDKCLEWNSLIGRILILRRPSSFALSSLVSLRLGVEFVRLEPLLLNKSISEKGEKSLDGTYASILRMVKNTSWKDKV